MYLSPERNEDMGSMRAAASPSGRCHAFDSKADGYVAAEAINIVFLKRLQDAVRDRDPIRAIIRGTSTNSAGRTPGISMPDPIAQANAIRDAYRFAGFSGEDLIDTGYLECHGTGTLAGDPIEVEGVATIFASTRPVNRPLPIGSVKSNVGHSEAASGLTSVIKVVLSLEHNKIPGTATFLDPNPRIDFASSRVKPFYNPIKWPQQSKRRASINSFGFGGSNAHAILESPEYLLDKSLPKFKSSYVNTDSIGDEFFTKANGAFSGIKSKPKLIVLSANDEDALKALIKKLSAHLLHPGVETTVEDLAYTLSERRSRLFYRAYSIQTSRQLNPSSFVISKLPSNPIKIGFIFTGQGAQWPMMGNDLLQRFPTAKMIVEALDKVLANLPEPPTWSLISKLTDEHDPDVLRKPEFSQPIVTALQLAYLGVLSDWGIKPLAVTGHSSGEIAAAVAAGYLTAEEAIKVAFFRGYAAKELPPARKLGMLAAGVSAGAVEKYINRNSRVQIACINSPRSVTLSGTEEALANILNRLQADGHFARLLQVNYAYHSSYMDKIAVRYSQLLQAHTSKHGTEHDGAVTMFSSVTGSRWDGATDSTYWLRNLRSQVQFFDAARAMIEGKEGVNFLIEVGPSNTLAGPLTQIFESACSLMLPPIYTSVAVRGPETLMALYGVAGRLFTAGGPVNLYHVNELQKASPSVLVDLPNYPWNRSKKYWHESLASKDWRFRPFVKHDLLGTKIPGTSWQSPIWKNKLRLDHIAWLKDHKLGNKTIFPGTGYICMAMEAMYQAAYMKIWKGDAPKKYAYRLRDIKFLKALILDDLENPPLIMLDLTPPLGSNPLWYHFKISAEVLGTWSDHASGFIRIDTEFWTEKAPAPVLVPFENPMSHIKWYKKMIEYGFNFGPSFQKIINMESTIGQRTGRSKVSLEAPASGWAQSFYVLHPACMDGCFQSVTAIWDDDDENVDTLIPSQIDSLFVPYRSHQPEYGISVAHSHFLGVGRKELLRNHAFSCMVYHPENGDLLFDLKGLRYATLGSTENKSPAHIYCQLTWDADITLLDEIGLNRITDKAAAKTTITDHDLNLNVVHRLIDLVAYKNPRLNVVEINLNPLDSSSLWFDNKRSMPTLRTTFSQYTLASSRADTLVEARQKFSATEQTEYLVVDFTQGQASLESKFDLAIVKMPPYPVENLCQCLEVVKRWLKETGIALFIDTRCNLESMEGISTMVGLQTMWKSNSVVLSRKGYPCKLSPSRELYIIHFKDQNTQHLQSELKASFSNIFTLTEPGVIPLESNVLVVYELHASAMSNLNQNQWAILNCLVQKQCHVLWVTKSAQMSVTHPENALVNGLFRTLRNETPFLTMLNLDVEQASGNATVEAIKKCLDLLNQTESQNSVDSEFTERAGVINISRIIPDMSLSRINDIAFRKTPEMMPINNPQSTIKLRAERVGNLDSLQYSEIYVEPPPLPAGWVEIDVVASGVNFKDVASTIGLIPENEHLLGGEGSGFITRIGTGVDTFIQGERVAFLKRGSFGNRVQASAKVVHAIPDSMTLDEAATIPCVFATSIYSLFHLASIKRGDRVLIHSATGGVGLSAIQICHYIGAEVGYIMNAWSQPY